MLPFLLPLWETDATLRAAAQESVQASVTSLGSGAALTGGDLTLDARAASPRAAYLALIHANYAHAFDLTVGSGAGPPSYNLDADTALSATWTPSPRTFLSLESEGSLATTLGIHADTRLLALDPFLFGQRLDYAWGHTLSFSVGATPRSSLTVECGYLQTGALAAESAVIPPADQASGLPAARRLRRLPAPVGVDTHEVHASISPSHDVDARDAITPELAYTYTHYNHALLEPDLSTGRGPADIHTVTLSAAASREITRQLTAGATLGLSVGNAMPALHSGHPVLSPDAGLQIRWTGKRGRVTARAAYGYTSLGPLVGHGQQATANLKIDLRPWDGARRRDLLLHGALRFSHGGAPLGADPQPLIPGLPVLPASAVLTATTLAARTRVDIPIRRGLALTTGGELAFARGVIDAPPPAGQDSRELRVTFTLGLAATLSTDRRRTVPRDPEADAEEAARRTPPAAAPGARWEDRTRTSSEDAIDRDWQQEPP